MRRGYIRMGSLYVGGCGKCAGVRHIKNTRFVHHEAEIERNCAGEERWKREATKALIKVVRGVGGSTGSALLCIPRLFSQEGLKTSMKHGRGGAAKYGQKLKGYTTIITPFRSQQIESPSAYHYDIEQQFTSPGFKSAFPGPCGSLFIGTRLAIS